VINVNVNVYVYVCDNSAPRNENGHSNRMRCIVNAIRDVGICKVYVSGNSMGEDVLNEFFSNEKGNIILNCEKIENKIQSNEMDLYFIHLGGGTVGVGGQCCGDKGSIKLVNQIIDHNHNHNHKISVIGYTGGSSKACPVPDDFDKAIKQSPELYRYYNGITNDESFTFKVFYKKWLDLISNNGDKIVTPPPFEYVQYYSSVETVSCLLKYSFDSLENAEQQQKSSCNDSFWIPLFDSMLDDHWGENELAELKKVWDKKGVVDSLKSIDYENKCIRQ